MKKERDKKMRKIADILEDLTCVIDSLIDSETEESKLNLIEDLEQELYEYAILQENNFL